MNQRNRSKTTTPNWKRSRREKQPSAIDPTHARSRDLPALGDDQRPRPDPAKRVEHYRVSIFGSSRIRRGDPIYEK
jgi:hypothetical protein